MLRVRVASPAIRYNSLAERCLACLPVSGSAAQKPVAKTVITVLARTKEPHMPKLKQKLPSYRLHKASGQAVVTLRGRDHYLGSYGSAESHTDYKRLIAEWLSESYPLVSS